MSFSLKAGGFVLELGPTFNTFEAGRVPFSFHSTKIKLVCDSNPATGTQRWFTVASLTGFDLKKSMIR